MDKKQLQLGMNPSTASHRLVKDLLFKFIPSKECHQCGKEMTREDFSIEHIEAWLDSEDPVKLFFNLDNISFSHLSCNISAGRRLHAHQSDEDRLEAKCRKAEKESIQKKSKYDPEKRKLIYKTKGY